MGGEGDTARTPGTAPGWGQTPAFQHSALFSFMFCQGSNRKEKAAAASGGCLQPWPGGPKEGVSTGNAKVEPRAHGQGENYLCGQQNIMCLLQLTPRPPYQSEGQEHRLLDANSIIIKDSERQLLEVSLTSERIWGLYPVSSNSESWEGIERNTLLRTSFSKTSVGKPKPPRWLCQQQPTARCLLHEISQVEKQLRKRGMQTCSVNPRNSVLFSGMMMQWRNAPDRIFTTTATASLIRYSCLAEKSTEMTEKCQLNWKVSRVTSIQSSFPLGQRIMRSTIRFAQKEETVL